MVNKKIN